jgi:hypothetical protein
VLKVEDWAEIRRLRLAEGVPVKEIARRLGVARNTVRAALTSDRPPTYQRALRGSVVDPYEPQIRALLKDWPKMPAPVIAQRIGWSYSEGPLKKLLARIRPEYVGIDPVDRVIYQPGQLILFAAALTATSHTGQVSDLADRATRHPRRNPHRRRHRQIARMRTHESRVLRGARVEDVVSFTVSMSIGPGRPSRCSAVNTNTRRIASTLRSRWRLWLASHYAPR